MLIFMCYYCYSVPVDKKSFGPITYMEIEKSSPFLPYIHIAVTARTHYIDCSRLKKLDGAAAATIEPMDL